MGRRPALRTARHLRSARRNRNPYRASAQRLPRLRRHFFGSAHVAADLALVNREDESPARVSTISLQLKNADPKRSNYTLNVIADDRLMKPAHRRRLRWRSPAARFFRRRSLGKNHAQTSSAENHAQTSSGENHTRAWCLPLCGQVQSTASNLPKRPSRT